MGLISAKRAADRAAEEARREERCRNFPEPPPPRLRRGLLTYPRTYPPTPQSVPEYNAFRRAYNRGGGMLFTARLMDDICYRIERLEGRA